jgi:prepilin-type N-terminal cleavage/methylation domain-containing protein
MAETLFLQKHKKAFSLIELSIVVLIISILIAGSLTASVSVINNAKVKVTRDRMAEIYKALGNYLLINGSLPCPASIISIKASDSTYGTSIGTAGTCSGTGVYNSSVATNLVYGMVPVRSLGLGNDLAEDGFQDKIAYIVDKNFTGTTFGTTATATSNMTINEIPGSATQTLTNDAIFALVSYGANQSGAFGINSASKNTRSTDSSEMQNDLDSTSAPAFGKTKIFDAKNSDLFDDIVFYKTRNALVADFNAFSAIYCVAGTVSLTYGSAASYSFAQSFYDQVAISTTICPSGYQTTSTYPTVRCGAFGVWQSFATNPCTK